MHRVWDTFKHPPKPLVTSCQVEVNQGHEAKRSKFSFGLNDRLHIFSPHFRIERETDAKILFEWYNREK